MSMPLAQREVTARDRLRVEQAQWLPLWRDCATFCCPHKRRTVDNAFAKLDAEYRPRFDPIRQSSIAIDSLNVLSGGCTSWLLPGGEEGFGGMWEPQEVFKGGARDVVADWLADCTQKAIPYLESGRFFTAGHSMFQDLGWAGTSGMMISEGGEDENPIVCEAMAPTDFVLERDWLGRVIRVIITWTKTASLIKDQFNQPGDVVPERVTKECESNQGEQKHELIQSIYKRTSGEMDVERQHEPKGQPYGSCWIHVETKTVMRERGEMEMPFVSPRWNTWAGTGSSAYGTSPAMEAIADIRGLNLLHMVQGAMAEVYLNPRVKAKAGLQGAVDLSPGGVTQVLNETDVQEWAVAGSYQISDVYTDLLMRQVRRHFFTDLFEAITPLAQMKGKDLTNYVTQSIQQEAAARITPAMGQVKQDFFEPALKRVFNILFRRGIFDEPPQEAYYVDSARYAHLLPPNVAQANRLTRIINSRKSAAFIQSMSRALQIAPVDPTIFDFYDFAKITADLDRGDGLPPEWRNPEEKVRKIREERKRTAQQQLVQSTAADAIANHPRDVAEIAGLGADAA